jgi:hypothetical protein
MVNRSARRRYILGGIFFLLMSIGVAAAYFLTQQSQDIRQQASVVNYDVVMSAEERDKRARELMMGTEPEEASETQVVTSKDDCLGDLCELLPDGTYRTEKSESTTDKPVTSELVIVTNEADCGEVCIALPNGTYQTDESESSDSNDSSNPEPDSLGETGTGGSIDEAREFQEDKFGEAPEIIEDEADTTVVDRYTSQYEKFVEDEAEPEEAPEEEESSSNPSAETSIDDRRQFQEDKFGETPEKVVVTSITIDDQLTTAPSSYDDYVDYMNPVAPMPSSDSDAPYVGYGAPTSINVGEAETITNEDEENLHLWQQAQQSEVVHDVAEVVATSLYSGWEAIYGEEKAFEYASSIVNPDYNSGPDLFGNYVSSCQGSVADCNGGSAALGGVAVAAAAASIYAAPIVASSVVEAAPVIANTAVSTANTVGSAASTAYGAANAAATATYAYGSATTAVTLNAVTATGAYSAAATALSSVAGTTVAGSVTIGTVASHVGAAAGAYSMASTAFTTGIPIGELGIMVGGIDDFVGGFGNLGNTNLVSTINNSVGTTNDIVGLGTDLTGIDSPGWIPTNAGSFLISGVAASF